LLDSLWEFSRLRYKKPTAATASDGNKKVSGAGTSVDDSEGGVNTAPQVAGLTLAVNLSTGADLQVQTLPVLTAQKYIIECCTPCMSFWSSPDCPQLPIRRTTSI
jgi:hypothetical protein